MEEVSRTGEMKIISLILYMCSVTANTCMPPFVWPTQFTDSYECMVAGYSEALRKTKEIGPEEMNKHKIFIKFDCIESQIIIPKEKPTKQPKVET
jgi:hypothetical protein